MYYRAVKPVRLVPLLLMLAACGTSSGPADNATTDPAWTGQTRPMDVIQARNELMFQMERLMVPIDTLQVEPVRNVEQLHQHAKAIATMLQVMPHLFPPTTNLYKPEGPDYPTLALPAIWENFEVFNRMALAASRAASDFAGTSGDEALREAGGKLRAGCTACHARYLRTYVPQKPGPEDYEFDFDAALGLEE